MTTVNEQVPGNTSDGAERSDGTSVTNEGQPLLGGGTGNLWTGVRFTTVAIPNAAPIMSAILELYVPSTKYDQPDARVHGQAVNSATVFGTSAFNISSRARTTASTDWVGTDVGTGYKQVDVTAIVQEIVDRAGWASGNAMAFLLEALALGTGEGVACYHYDGSATFAAKLTVVYVAQKLAPPSITVPIGFGAPKLTQWLAPASLAVPVALGAPRTVQYLAAPSLAIPIVFGAPSLTQHLAPPSLAVPVTFGPIILGGGAAFSPGHGTAISGTHTARSTSGTHTATAISGRHTATALEHP